MASLTKEYSQQKRFGQVYTPAFIVDKMLDSISFRGKDILGKSILDSSCGNGRFLVKIAKKIIQTSPKTDLKNNLEYIYGWDIDEEAIKLCIQNLNELIESFDIKVDWQIQVCDSLEKIKNYQQKFDFIIGNPPYIRIQHLEEKQRKFIKNQYGFCKKGSTDAYIAFYELSYHLLKKDGLCALITPNTFFYNETAQDLREFFANQQIIKKISNYGDIQLFDNATTYSTIMVFGKKNQENFIYEQAQNQIKFVERKINFSEIKDTKTWQLSIKQIADNQGVKLKNIARIHVGVTTLLDRAYIFNISEIEQSYVWVESKLQGKIKLEKTILRPVIKASKYKSKNDKIKEYILFPYEKIDDKNQIISEEDLQNNFPLTYEYLLSIKSELDKRDNGKPNSVAWYAFGRSQGLDTSFGKKILFSPMNKKPNFILSENEHATFYSGYCIKYDGDYNRLLEQLNSQRMEEYIAVSSRDYRGGWKAYNKRVLEEFRVEL